MDRPYHIGTILRILAIAGVSSFITTATDSGSSEPDGPGESRRPGRPIAIAVKDGRASFDLPTPGPGCRSLVIVSALARDGGPYPIRLSTRPTDDPRPIERAIQLRLTRPNLEVPQLQPPPPVVTSVPPERRSFHLVAQGGDVTAASSYLAVHGRLRAVGKRIQIYVDVRDVGLVEESTVRDLVTTFDDRIYPEAAGRFGPASDVDRDGRFTVLFSSWLNRLAGGKVAVDGFVRGADLDPELSQPFGNRCDMMYLSTSLKAGPHLRTIVAHEYTHAVTFSRKVLSRGSSGFEEEGWLDEALAHLVEDSQGFSRSNIDYRVSAFLSSPESYRLVVEDYYAADLFRSHGNRGATYLFLRWCVDRYGPELLDALVRSDRRGPANLEAATGCSFAELFRSWTVALYLSGLDPLISIENAYRSIDPRAEIDDWILAGPRSLTVRATEIPHTWSAQGTTTHYVIVDGIPGAKGVRVHVQGPPGANLQITAVTLPDGMSRPELTVRRHRCTDGQIRFEADLSERDGLPMDLVAVAWEPLVPAEDRRTQAGKRGDLDRLGITRAFGNSTLPARGMLRSGPIPMTGFRGTEGPIIFKAVGTDPLGRRVAAWTLVDFGAETASLPVEKEKALR